MSINVVGKIDDPVRVRHVLVSVSDKSGLEDFVPGLRERCPGVRFFSTGGTFARLREILGEASTAADGVLWREPNDFSRCGCATLGFS